MSPLSFLARPQSWLWASHRYRATVSAAPNFAFELCLKQIDDADLEGLDLSSLRYVANGAEPVSIHTLRRFTERFGRFGFSPQPWPRSTVWPNAPSRSRCRRPAAARWSTA